MKIPITILIPMKIPLMFMISRDSSSFLPRWRGAHGGAIRPAPGRHGLCHSRAGGARWAGAEQVGDLMVILG